MGDSTQLVDAGMKLVPSVAKQALGNVLSHMGDYRTWAIKALAPVRDPLYIAWQADTPERDQFSGEMNDQGRVLEAFVDEVSGVISDAFNSEAPYTEVPL